MKTTPDIDCSPVAGCPAPCSAFLDDRVYCDICGYYTTPPPEYPNDTVCCCKGLQPWAMSNYPGEHRLVRTHPGNQESDKEQWYRREEVDAKLDNLNEQISVCHKALMICDGAMMGKVKPSSVAFKRINAILRPQNE